MEDPNRPIERTSLEERAELEAEAKRQAARRPRQTPAPLDARERATVAAFVDAVSDRKL